MTTPQPWSLPCDVQLAIAVAVKEHYRIDLCAACGGPEVFSKKTPQSRCFRCGMPREYMAVKQHKTSWRRCALCDKQNMAGIPLNRNYCRDCQALSDHERQKRLRWKAEREAATAQVPSETSMNTALDSEAAAEIDPVVENAKNEPEPV